MNTAFNVVDKDDNVIAVADLAALGLASTFDFTTTHHAGIFFQEGSNWLIYHGHDLKVGVNGQLVLTNSNGVETVLPTNFDGEYADYFVNQYNPVGKLKSSNLDIKVSKIAKDYTYFINNQLKLVDDRGKNLIKRGTEYVDETEVTWTPADWVVGDNENGFADGVNVANIYGLKFNEGAYTLITPIPASLNGALSFTAATGELYFKNTNQIELTEQITLKFNVKIEHKWGYDSTEFTVTLVPEK